MKHRKNVGHLSLALVGILSIIRTADAQTAAPTDPVYFADLSLKIAVQAELGIADPTSPQILALTELTANDKGITDLTGLERATNLASLSLSDNHISDVSALAGLSKLTSLSLSGNQISDISALAGLTNMDYLSLHDNQVSDIDAVLNLTKLTTLSLSSNRIGDISAVRNLTNLKTLYLFENQVSDISHVAYLTNLRTLSLYSNQISDISALADLTNLKYLYLDGNQVDDISSLASLTNLTTLSLSGNQIGDISAVGGLSHLITLHLFDNQVTDISVLAGLTQLTSLSLFDNQIRDISVLAGLTKLTTLDLSVNEIGDIWPLANLTKLAGLYLGSNQIDDITALAHLDRLQYLSVRRNRINSIGAIAGLTGLRYLNLSGNPLDADSVNVYVPQIRQANPEIELVFVPLGEILCVNASASYPDGDGTSFEEGFRSLQDALAVAAYSNGTVREIRIYSGVYTPDVGRDMVRGDTDASFNLLEGVRIVGGYGGDTVLSGDLNGDDNHFIDARDLLHDASRTDNSYTVVTARGVNDSAVLEGVIISGGHAADLSDDSPWSQKANGGGLFIERASPTILNCTFANNTALGNGGAVAAWDSGPVLEACRFQSNAASLSGGGLSSAVARLDVIGCTFSDNWASYGGAVHIDSSKTLVRNTTFRANHAVDAAGAVYNMLSGPDFMGCVFSGNQCLGYGGAVYNLDYYTTTLRNCTLVGNFAGYGFSIASESPTSAYQGKVNVLSSILWNVGQEIWCGDSAVATLNYCNIWGGWPSGTGNLAYVPQFIRSGYWDMEVTPQNSPNDPWTGGAQLVWVDGDYHLMLDSPCVDAGDPQAAASPDETDIDHNPRVVNGRVDIGAYEFQRY